MKHTSLSFSLVFSAIVLFVASACTKSIDVNSNISNTDASNVNNAAQAAVNVSTIAGKYGIKGDADGKGANARFWNPTKMVYDNRNHVLYVADGTVIRSIDAQNNVKSYLPYGKIATTMISWIWM